MFSQLQQEKECGMRGMEQERRGRRPAAPKPRGDVEELPTSFGKGSEMVLRKTATRPAKPGAVI